MKYFLFFTLLLGAQLSYGQTKLDFSTYKEDSPEWLMNSAQKGEQGDTRELKQQKVLREYDDFVLWRYEGFAYQGESTIYFDCFVSATPSGKVLDLIEISSGEADFFYEPDEEIVFFTPYLFEHLSYFESHDPDSEIIEVSESSYYVKLNKEGDLEMLHWGPEVVKSISIQPYIEDIREVITNTNTVAAEDWEIAAIEAPPYFVKAYHKEGIIDKLNYRIEEKNGQRVFEYYFSYGNLAFVYETFKGEHNDEHRYYFHRGEMIRWLEGPSKKEVLIDEKRFGQKKIEIFNKVARYYKFLDALIYDQRLEEVESEHY